MGERTGAMNDEEGGHKTPDQIRNEIRQTQREISDTVDSIQYRLSPAHMMDEAKDKFRDTSRRAGEGLMSRIKDNPIPAAIVGLGLWMMFRKDSKNEAEYEGNFDYRGDRVRYAGPSAYGYRDDFATGYGSSNDREFGTTGRGRMSQAADTVREKASSIKDKASDMVEGLEDKAHDLGERAHEFGDRAQEFGEETLDRAGEWGRHVGYQTRNATTQLWQSLEANPLVLGAAGAVIGALLGLSLPETDQENRFMGEASDAVKDSARDYAQEGVEKVKNVANAAGDAAASAASSEMKNVQSQGSSQSSGSTGMSAQAGRTMGTSGAMSSGGSASPARSGSGSTGTGTSSGIGATSGMGSGTGFSASGSGAESSATGSGSGSAAGTSNTPAKKGNTKNR